MADGRQGNLLTSLNEIDASRVLLVDLHDDLTDKVARFHQLADLSSIFGAGGTMLLGGETAYAVWTKARISFVHGNFVATVMLHQGLAENVLAAELVLGIDGNELPKKFHSTKLYVDALQ